MASRFRLEPTGDSDDGSALPAKIKNILWVSILLFNLRSLGFQRLDGPFYEIFKESSEMHKKGPLTCYS